VRRILQVVFAAGALFPPAIAGGQTDVKTCISAHADAQVLRGAKRLIESQEKLLACAVAECPAIIRADCGRWLDEVKAVLPTLVLAAVDEHGRDLADVAVTIDGKPLSARLDGSGQPVDPGEHRLRFTTKSGDVREVFVVAREGEKGRRVVAEFGAAPAEPSEAAAAEPGSPIPLATYVLGGVGVVALGSFTFFGLSGRSTESDLEECAPNCRRDDVDTMRREYLIADISLGVGVLSLGAATYFFLTNPAREPGRSEVGIAVTPVVGPGTLAFAAGGRF
jgi:hypothetical protein